MKKFALSLAMLGGIGFVGAGSASAADWHGSAHRFQPIGRVTPVYPNAGITGNCYGGGCSSGNCNNGCCSPGMPCRSGACNTGSSKGSCGSVGNRSYRYVPRRSVNREIGFNGLGMNFWYGR